MLRASSALPEAIPATAIVITFFLLIAQSRRYSIPGIIVKRDGTAFFATFFPLTKVLIGCDFPVRK